MDKAEIDSTIRIAGAIAFKNYVKRNWEIVSIRNNVNRLFEAHLSKNSLFKIH